MLWVMRAIRPRGTTEARAWMSSCRHKSSAGPAESMPASTRSRCRARSLPTRVLHLKARPVGRSRPVHQRGRRRRAGPQRPPGKLVVVVVLVVVELLLLPLLLAVLASSLRDTRTTTARNPQGSMKPSSTSRTTRRRGAQQAGRDTKTTSWPRHRKRRLSWGLRRAILFTIGEKATTNKLFERACSCGLSATLWKRLSHCLCCASLRRCVCVWAPHRELHLLSESRAASCVQARLADIMLAGVVFQDWVHRKLFCTLCMFAPQVL
mmetsp:Transcript_27696/g.70156  ORF Transcript_27696/g.70156 Transcript_27696/m.70156 type:complete len:265 (+) Transcript_27696:101-895(+)